MKNALTIDVEDWYHTMDFNFPLSKWNSFEDRLHYGMNAILEILSKHQVQATFFVLGYAAKKHPKLIRELANEGHEIGSHGSFHRMVFTQTQQEFREDVRASKCLIEDIIGKKVEFFRASSWSISPKTLWALHILEEEGYTCDSSIQPFKTPLSGFRNAPITPFYPCINGKTLKLLEFPSTVVSLGKVRFPFCGGLYMRALPLSFIKSALKKVNKERNGMLYIHPWEMDNDQPRLKVPPHIKFTHYYNLDKTIDKLDHLLEEFEFVPLGDIIKGRQYPVLSIQ